MRDCWKLEKFFLFFGLVEDRGTSIAFEFLTATICDKLVGSSNKDVDRLFNSFVWRWFDGIGRS
jgi:hypothetical protein